MASREGKDVKVGIRKGESERKERKRGRERPT